MTREEIINTINNIKAGEFFRITYKSVLPLKAEFKKQGYSIVKTTEATVRTGCDYDNLESVKEAKEEKTQNGITESKPRTNNYQWVIEDKVSYNTNTDKYYLRIAPLNNGGANKKTTYTVTNLTETYTLEKLEETEKSLVIASYFGNAYTPSPVQNISFDNIISIGKVAD